MVIIPCHHGFPHQGGHRVSVYHRRHPRPIRRRARPTPKTRRAPFLPLLARPLAPPAWLFHGRPVKILDGSTVLMPDTAANQAAYARQRSQAPGLGFPIARILVVFSLAVGTVLEAAVGPHQGKPTSELALLRRALAEFQSGALALADRFFCSYWGLAEWQPSSPGQNPSRSPTG